MTLEPVDKEFCELRHKAASGDIQNLRTEVLSLNRTVRGFNGEPGVVGDIRAIKETLTGIKKWGWKVLILVIVLSAVAGERAVTILVDAFSSPVVEAVAAEPDK